VAILDATATREVLKTFRNLVSLTLAVEWRLAHGRSHLCELPFFRSRNIERMRTCRHWKQVFSQRRQRSVQEDDGSPPLLLTHGATTNPDHTSKSCSNKQADMSTPPPSPICKAATTSFAASPANQVWKKPERTSATAAMDGAANQARDNEQGTLPRTQPHQPNGQSYAAGQRRRHKNN
jgi:hypothetical protein